MGTLRSWKKRPRDAAMHAMPCSMHAHVGRGQIGLLRHTASPITVTAAAQKKCTVRRLPRKGRSNAPPAGSRSAQIPRDRTSTAAD